MTINKTYLEIALILSPIMGAWLAYSSKHGFIDRVVSFICSTTGFFMYFMIFYFGVVWAIS
jgi:hypothetical protein